MGFGSLYMDSWYFILVIPALIFSAIAQSRVNSTFRRYSNVGNSRNITGAQVAEMILRNNNISNVRVQSIPGSLTDHFDPRNNVVSLSESVYGSSSVAAIGVAAHEVGHAIQYSIGYAPIRLRAIIIPITNFGSKVSPLLIIAGFFLQLEPLVMIGILLFSTMTLFQLLTLPVEFNASNRAVKTLDSTGILNGDELRGAKKVLSAAALTYVAALLTSMASLIRLILISQGRRRRR